MELYYNKITPWLARAMEHGMPVRKKKFVAKGRARTLGALCARLDKLKAAKKKPASGGTRRKSSSTKKKSSTSSRRGTTKKRSTTKRKSSRRDSAYDYARVPAKKRTIKRRTVRSATGPWMLRDHESGRLVPRNAGMPGRRADGTFAKSRRTAGRDPAWFGEPRRHAAAARKGAKTRSRSGAKKTKSRSRSGGPCGGRRDPAWFGDSRRHACAGSLSRPGSRRDGAQSRRKPGRRDPAWFGQSERHAFAAEKGWRRVAKPGWVPARVTGKAKKSRPGSRRDLGRAKGRGPTTRGLPRDSRGHFLPRTRDRRY